MSRERMLRTRLLLELGLSGSGVSRAVYRAFGSVPRHPFLAEQPLDAVYRNRSIVTKTVDGFPVSSSSTPSTMAAMLEQLRVRPGHRVLEIGTGTGYNAALLVHLVGDAGKVTSVDIDPEVAQQASRNLRAAGYGAARVLVRDGAAGYANGAPYDRIVVTAGCRQIAPPWMDELVEGGILVVPVRVNSAQLCVTLVKRHRTLTCRHAFPCGFVPLRSAAHAIERPLELAPDVVGVADVDVDEVARASLVALARGDGQRAVTAALFPGGPTPFGYLIFETQPIVQLYRREGEELTYRSLALVGSDGSTVALSIPPWGWLAAGDSAATSGGGRAIEELAQTLARWDRAGRPGVPDHFCLTPADPRWYTRVGLAIEEEETGESRHGRRHA